MPEPESRPTFLPAWLGWVISALLLAVVAFLLGRQWDHDHKKPADGSSLASTSSPPVVESTKTSIPPVPDVRPAPRLEATPTNGAADAARDEKLQQDKRNAEAQAMRDAVVASPGAERRVKLEQLKTLRETFVAAAKGVGGLTFEGTKYGRVRNPDRVQMQNWKDALAVNREKYLSLRTELEPSADRTQVEKELKDLGRTIQTAIDFAE